MQNIRSNKRATRVSNGHRCCNANFRDHKALSVGGAILAGRSDATSVTLSVCKHRRSVAQTTLPAYFASKLSDSEGEAEEARVFLELAFRCGYILQQEMEQLDSTYDGILAQLVHMIDHKDQWTIRPGLKSR